MIATLFGPLLATLYDHARAYGYAPLSGISEGTIAAAFLGLILAVLLLIYERWGRFIK